MDPAEFQKVLLLATEETMADPYLREYLSILPPLASHAHNSPKEIEHVFLEKICEVINKKLVLHFPRGRKLFLLALVDKEKKPILKAHVYWTKDPPVEVGALSLCVSLDSQSKESPLMVEFLWELHSCEPVAGKYPLSPHISHLHRTVDSALLPRFNEEENRLIFIDLEWVSCYKGNDEKPCVNPQQISEFSFLTREHFYYSGYLKVLPSYLKRMHKKLLVKMGISPEEMQARHLYGKTFLEEWGETLIPMVEGAEEKYCVFLSYGTEDGKILKKLFAPNQQRKVKFIDVSGHFEIFNFGQMAILNGLGVTFTHDFSSDMDVKALFLIYEVFSTCVTVDDSRNLQLALQFHKMFLQAQAEEDKQKLSYYLSYLLAEEKNRILFDNAVALAKGKVAEGYFS